MSRWIQTEVAAAIRGLWSSVPSQAASVQLWADWYARKAEVFDLIAATNPAWSAQASALAARARYEARSIALDI